MLVLKWHESVNAYSHSRLRAFFVRLRDLCEPFGIRLDIHRSFPVAVGDSWHSEGRSATKVNLFAEGRRLTGIRYVLTRFRHAATGGAGRDF